MDTGFRLKDLREQRGAVKGRMDALRNKISSEARNMTEGEQDAWDGLKQSYATLGERIADIEAAKGGIARACRSIPGKHDQSWEGHTGDDDDDDDDDDGTSARGSREDRAYAFQAWARSQFSLTLTRRHESALRATGVDPRAKEFSMRLNTHSRAAMSVGVATTGGYTVAESFSDALEIALVSNSGVRGTVDEFRTDTGADMPYPSLDDTSNTGAIVAEGSEVHYSEPTAALAATFRAFKYTSGGILISNELLNDSAFNLEAILGGMIGTRIGKAQGAHFTTGGGTTEPQGIVTASTLGITTASATAITGSELTRLAYSVDPAHRVGSKVGYMCHDSLIGYLMTLLDSTGRPLLRESFRDGARGLLLNGLPLSVNQFMAATLSGAPVTATKHVLFGDMSKMKIRDVGEVRLRRLDERWAERDQVGFIGFLRSDSRCVATSAIKHLLQA